VQSLRCEKESVRWFALRRSRNGAEPTPVEAANVPGSQALLQNNRPNETQEEADEPEVRGENPHHKLRHKKKPTNQK
jgi:hypothetical protein